MTGAVFLTIIGVALSVIIALALLVLWMKAKQDKMLDKEFNLALKKAVEASDFVIDRKFGTRLFVSKVTKQIMYWHNGKVNITSFDQLDHIHPTVKSTGRSYSNEVNSALRIYLKIESGEPEEITFFSFNNPEELFECVEYFTLIAGKKILKALPIPKDDFLMKKFTGTIDGLSKKLANVGPDFT